MSKQKKGTKQVNKREWEEAARGERCLLCWKKKCICSEDYGDCDACVSETNRKNR